jgi:hypothetical protein
LIDCKSAIPGSKSGRGLSLVEISYEKGMVMVLIARIIGLSLVTGGLGAVLGLALFGQYSDGSGISLFIACVGGIIGAVAGAAREIVTALSQRLSS